MTLAISEPAMFNLSAGGGLFTVGIVFFALGEKYPICHVIWHVFVMVGSLLQFNSLFYHVV